MNSIHERLEGGDLRSIGEADLVLEDLHICIKILHYMMKYPPQV